MSWNNHSPPLSLFLGMVLPQQQQHSYLEKNNSVFEYLLSLSVKEGAPARELRALLTGGLSDSEARLPTCFLGSLLLRGSN